MAKVLYVIPPGQDMGGIITSSEQLMLGFKEAGHKPSFALLRSGGASGGQPRGQHALDYSIGPGTGLLMHPVHGWRGPCYSTSRPDEWLAYANTFNCVVFGALYGLRNKDTEGRSDWARCITGIKPPVVAMVRDDHLPSRTPWAMAFAPYVAGWAGVQQCSYDSIQGLGRTALIFSGHGPAHPMAATAVRRWNTALAIATWKPWKRGRQLLQAWPAVAGMNLIMAGDGIELRYMRSKEKAREKDFNADGSRVWNAALAAGVSYLGCVSEDTRDDLLLRCKFLIDASLRHNTGQINRSVVEAMRHGAIPICDPRFISGSDDGSGELFTAYENYLPIRADADPATLAGHITGHARAKRNLEDVRLRNLDLVELFSRRAAAAQLVKLALGKKAGYKFSLGLDPEKLARGRAAFAEIFGELTDAN